MDPAKLHEFATRYTAAWCSQNAPGVASFFAEGGSLKINDGSPSVGRTAITAAAWGFMTACPGANLFRSASSAFANTDRLPEYTIARESSSATGSDRAGNTR